ncbi:unnamed protein product [Phytophthora fragariaefolia]|uniref:Unnamed protein product n=1 Tax=Phytophthora fragariaefolia TaxID=1490495 RepID=A0A9W6Y224_9STRA|nr:unnamed protein product [Phytophthora fragariaefolia]
MQLYGFIIPTIMLAFSAQQVTGAKTCKTLLDNDSTLVKSLATAYQDDYSDFPFETVFSDLHNAVPWLSKCAAAMDPVAVFISMRMSSSFRACVRKIEETNLDEGLGVREGWQALCPLLRNTVVPCVKNAMIEIVMDAFASTNGCCDPFLEQVDTLFSDSLTAVVEKLSQYAVNTLCSERIFTNLHGKATTELCGLSIVKSFAFIEHEDDIVPLLGLLQLPNAGMCDAFAGKQFKLTNGSEFTIEFGTRGSDTMGICLQPIDALLKYVASWPLFTESWDAAGTSFSPSSLFAAGDSLSFALLKSWYETPTNLPSILRRTLEKFVEAALALTSDYSNYYDYNDTDYGYYYDNNTIYGPGDFTGSNNSDENIVGDFNSSDSHSNDVYVDDGYNVPESIIGNSSEEVGYGYFYGYVAPENSSSNSSDDVGYGYDYGYVAPERSSSNSSEDVGYGYDYGYVAPESGSSNSSDDVGYGYDYDNNSTMYYSESSTYGGYYVGYWSASSEGDSNLVLVLLERLVADIGTMLLHVPNNGGCTFSSQTVTLPFDLSKVSAIDAMATSVTSAPTAVTTVSTISTQSSGAAGVPVVAMATTIVIIWGASSIGMI